MSTKSQRSVNWRPEEDEALCRGWVSVSDDVAIGTNLASDTFWKRGQQFAVNSEDNSWDYYPSPYDGGY
ncbi:unnamed protein product [Prunus armeniaca]